VGEYIDALRKHCPTISVSTRFDAIMHETGHRLDAAQAFLADVKKVPQEGCPGLERGDDANR